MRFASFSLSSIIGLVFLGALVAAEPSHAGRRGSVGPMRLSSFKRGQGKTTDNRALRHRNGFARQAINHKRGAGRGYGSMPSLDHATRTLGIHERRAPAPAAPRKRGKRTLPSMRPGMSSPIQQAGNNNGGSAPNNVIALHSSGNSTSASSGSSVSNANSGSSSSSANTNANSGSYSSSNSHSSSSSSSSYSSSNSESHSSSSSNSYNLNSSGSYASTSNGSSGTGSNGSVNAASYKGNGSSSSGGSSSSSNSGSGSSSSSYSSSGSSSSSSNSMSSSSGGTSLTSGSSSSSGGDSSLSLSSADESDDDETCIDDGSDSSDSSTSTGTTDSTASTADTSEDDCVDDGEDDEPTGTTSTPSASASGAMSSGSGTPAVSGTKYSGNATWYTQNGKAGACGTVASDSDKVVALFTSVYGSGSNCGKTVLLTNAATGASVTAVVRDECPTCGGANDIDLSVGAFSAIGKQSDGEIKITWGFV